MNPTERLLEQQKEMIAVVTRQTATMQTFIQAQAERLARRNTKFVVAVDNNSSYQGLQYSGGTTTLPVSLPVNLNDFSKILVEIKTKDSSASAFYGIALLNEGRYGLSLQHIDWRGLDRTALAFCAGQLWSQNNAAGAESGKLSENISIISARFDGPFSLCRFAFVGFDYDDNGDLTVPAITFTELTVTAQP